VLNGEQFVIDETMRGSVSDHKVELLFAVDNEDGSQDDVLLEMTDVEFSAFVKCVRKASEKFSFYISWDNDDV
jgi:hypothetical protein